MDTESNSYSQTRISESCFIVYFLNSKTSLQMEGHANTWGREETSKVRSFFHRWASHFFWRNRKGMSSEKKLKDESAKMERRDSW